ncbi:N-6 DNA methylase [Lactobacillus equicursoris]|uniref:N-6 DNA methylase n=1 Tax=Lactobacillus equicursoris TaxID=420645 RepID=A0A844FPC0_9LACO|nr:N-6 DNA methylase [Lactobacillus equicursoris]MST80228.1 N-6 DNA methylase [Lactobacillus equicursoris]
MADERLIKSDDRVKDIGEVFTPQRIVDLMLDQPEITAKVNDLKSTFLEPSAGEGVFLVEILKRKMKVALELSKNIAKFEDNCLLALSSLYGIELMEDNVEMLVMNMLQEFISSYLAGIASLDPKTKQNDKVIKSAKVIIRANMAQGDALTYKTSTDDPIIFSEWDTYQKNGRLFVQRKEQTFESIVAGEDSGNSIAAPQQEEMDLFSSYETDEEGDLEVKAVESIYHQYDAVRMTDVYKELVHVETEK